MTDKNEWIGWMYSINSIACMCCLSAFEIWLLIKNRNKIRIYIHRDYYNLQESPEMQLIHVGHCIDSLRQIIMCHGDTELVTYEYVSEKQYRNPLPNPNFIVERKCRNWDSIVSWVERHKTDRGKAESRASWEGKHGAA